MCNWDLTEPALVGYKNIDHVQLLSGSHRWAAALAAGIDIPVIIYSREEIYDAYGDLARWSQIMSSGDSCEAHQPTE